MCDSFQIHQINPFPFSFLTVNSTKISTEGATPNSEGRKPWIYRRYLGYEVCRTDTYYIY